MSTQITCLGSSAISSRSKSKWPDLFDEFKKQQEEKAISSSSDADADVDADVDAEAETDADSNADADGNQEKSIDEDTNQQHK